MKNYNRINLKLFKTNSNKFNNIMNSQNSLLNNTLNQNNTISNYK